MSDPAVPPPAAQQPDEPEPARRDADPATGHAYLPPAPEQGPSLRSKLLKALAVVVAVVVVLVLRSVMSGDFLRCLRPERT